MSKPRILIVEDEALTVLALKRELSALGYEIAGEACTAADALFVAESKEPDLVLMDIQLAGGISGVGAAAAIRGQLDIPVVFLTAHAAEETLAQAVESGAFAYLLKPYTTAELKATIEIALHKHEAESAMRRALTSAHGSVRPSRDADESHLEPRSDQEKTTHEAGQMQDASPAPNPLGLGVGAAGGGMAGAALGSAIGGPIGAAVGAMFGGVLGACGGRGIARAVDGNDGLGLIDANDFPPSADANTHDVLRYEDKDYVQSCADYAGPYDHCASLALPWDEVRPFTRRRWDRLAGVIAPRDSDRGLRGGI